MKWKIGNNKTENEAKRTVIRGGNQSQSKNRQAKMLNQGKNDSIIKFTEERKREREKREKGD